jgi:hypothetical protein
MGLGIVNLKGKKEAKLSEPKGRQDGRLAGWCDWQQPVAPHAASTPGGWGSLCYGPNDVGWSLGSQ